MHARGHLEGVPAWWWWDLIWIAKGSTSWSRPQARPAWWTALHSFPYGWDTQAKLQGQGGNEGANHTRRTHSPLPPIYSTYYMVKINISRKLDEHNWESKYPLGHRRERGAQVWEPREQRLRVGNDRIVFWGKRRDQLVFHRKKKNGFVFLSFFKKKLIILHWSPRKTTPSSTKLKRYQ